MEQPIDYECQSYKLLTGNMTMPEIWQEYWSGSRSPLQ